MLGVGCNLGFEQDLESHVHAAVRVSVLIRIAVESGSNIEGLFQKVGHADTHVSDIRLKVSVFHCQSVDAARLPFTVTSSTPGRVQTDGRR
jgi:hypothetical protein